MIRPLLAALAICFTFSAQAHAQESKPKSPAEPIKETAAAFLKQAEKHVYHPDLDGLESLAFKVNREYAPGKTLWSIIVEWKSAAGATVKGFVSEAAPIPAAMKPQVEASLPVVGEVFASEQIGQFLTYLQSVATPTLDGTDDGFVRLRLSPKPGGKAGFAEKVLLFDADRTLRKARTTQPDRSTLVEAYDWRPLEEGSPQLLLKSVTASLTIQGMNITRMTTYNFTKVDRWYLLTSQSIKTSGIPNSPVRNEDLKFTSFVVNGKPIEVR